MEYLATQGHPGRMAPGVMTAAIADALIVGSGIIEGYAVAMIQMDALTAKKGACPRPCAARARRAPLTTQGGCCVCSAGVYSGDTIVVEFEVTEVVPSKSNPSRGVVATHQVVKNQNDEVVLEYDVKRMLKRSDAD